MKMLVYKKTTTIICLLAAVTFAALTSMSSDHDEHHGPKNLKVLPKNIPHEMLHKVMDDWSEALGVHCNFCHAGGEGGKLDFASDAKPEKNMAREMYKMTAKINTKYFEGKKDSLNMVIGDIKCVTCHHGSPHPDEAAFAPDMKNHGPQMMHHDGPPPVKPDSTGK
ncbi:c-type cytochrome [Mucilaginibacter sp. L196]|uniref:c-type cytochrome n=1 Tax=Mucilaginibacter sp. L196 TaxID=1641870 RepID=UPI00131C8F90|nr:c-type cytochrome [Mucilaginibacter sp. L196]